MKKGLILWMLLAVFAGGRANPVERLLERIDRGAADKFKMEVVKADEDFFELDQEGDKVVIRGNNYVSLATGVNWYLKYYAGIHLSWNQMKVRLPESLPVVKQKERHTTALPYRYDFNYCTYSYSMAFWDWERWEKEIDWMALHGINMPLTVTGVEVVWMNVLEKLGYQKEEMNRFIAGPGFLAWWYMNNLEGWGGPNPDSWYRQQEQLLHKILNRMSEFGMEPVLPGYAGMIPADAGEKLGLDVTDPGKWCGFRRPGFLQPTDPAFGKIADLYYAEMRRLCGKVRFFSIDPFHEGGNTEGVDLTATGRAILKAMKKSNPEAVWVIQAWQANPRPAMVDGLKAGDLLVLDLSSENRPMWGDPDSPWYREKGYKQHDWLFCMLLNYGGNVGMYGRMDRIIEAFYRAKDHPNGRTLKGVGMTMEGIENNPVMYELILELPWRQEKFGKEKWLEGYVFARYGKNDPHLLKAWQIMAETAYNCPEIREGTTESVFCARPAEDIRSASSWGSSRMYYQAEEFRKAARYMLEVAEQYKGNNNFEYDLVDVVRQTIADRGNELQKQVTAAYRAKNQKLFTRLSEEFLELILLQDRLLSCRTEFMVGTWLQQARKIGAGPEEKELYEWNARTQITVWGDRIAADQGGLHDYAHREWAGLLKDFYYSRWKTWFKELKNRLEGKTPQKIDWYGMEEPWTRQRNDYAVLPQGEPVAVAREVFEKIFP